MAVEARRGCGYRKIGGTYLVSGPGGLPCDRLPFPLTVCPTCSCGIKQTRGWTWVNPAVIFGGAHRVDIPAPAGCVDERPERCPACNGLVDRAGLLWIGERFYKTTADFMAEGVQLGFSRRITAIPRDFKVGETWVLIAHPKAVRVTTHQETALVTLESWTPGIFLVWKPERIEKICAESTRDSDEVKKLVERGITPVFVPDNDPDHQGSVYDKAEPELDDDPQVNDEPPPDVGPPGSGAVITEYVGNEPGFEDDEAYAFDGGAAADNHAEEIAEREAEGER